MMSKYDNIPLLRWIVTPLVIVAMLPVLALFFAFIFFILAIGAALMSIFIMTMAIIETIEQKRMTKAIEKELYSGLKR